MTHHPEDSQPKSETPSRFCRPKLRERFTIQKPTTHLYTTPMTHNEIPYQVVLQPKTLPTLMHPNSNSPLLTHTTQFPHLLPYNHNNQITRLFPLYFFPHARIQIQQHISETQIYQILFTNSRFTTTASP